MESMIAEEIKKMVQNSLKDLKKEGKIKFDKLSPYGRSTEGRPEIKVEHPADMALGDYATNVALIIAKKENTNPQEIVNFIVEKIKEKKPSFIEKIEAVNGFINFFISKEYLATELLNILKEKEKYGSGDTAEGLLEKKKKILIEYSSPNIAKPFGIGHLRSTIIGQAIYNLYNFLGWKCTGVNHLGDWGTPHGKIIYQIKINNLNVKELSVKDLENLYVDFHKDAESNPAIEEEARDWFRKLEEGDKEARRIWGHTQKISLEEFQRIYDLLEVNIDNVMGESFYEDMLEDIIKECKDKKIAKNSEGALVIDFEVAKEGQALRGGPGPPLPGNLPPAMLLKSDGATTYFTRDLAALKYRLNKFKPGVLVYETGAEQTLHFKQVFAAVRMLGWVKGEKLVHVAHGFYRWEHGKFSTRSGETIHLEEVLEEAIQRAKDIIEDSAPPKGGEPSPNESGRETARLVRRSFSEGGGLSDSEKEEVAKAVGIGGVKYNDLSHNPAGDIIFDWDKILNLKGNSAPYIQYTYARCKSILTKGGQSAPPGSPRSRGGLWRSDPLLSPYVGGPSFAPPSSETTEGHSEASAGRRTPTGGTTPTAEELGIMRLIYRFPEVVGEAAEKFSPNLLCNFVFDLSGAFNLFYGAHRVLGAENEEAKTFRLALTAATAQVLHNGLDLLGIKTPERL